MIKKFGFKNRLPQGEGIVKIRGLGRGHNHSTILTHILRMPLPMGFTHHNAAEANFSMNLNIH